MAGRIVTISFTALDAGGGVPKVNRDLHAAFSDRECVHFCWDDCARSLTIHEVNLQEWQKARLLNDWLVRNRYVMADDVVIADGFWADGLEHLPKVISHSHGIWSHLTKEDVDAGKGPDMPLHHAAQVAFRQKWTRLGKPLTAVSDFIADQMRLQWGFESTVINNGVDTDLYRPMEFKKEIPGRPLVIHGVNNRGNTNKGWHHIDLLERVEPYGAIIRSLDEAHDFFKLYSDHPWQKHEVMAQADLVVHPSGYEGNSVFVAEAIACGVPIVGYEVGAMADPDASICGLIEERSRRSPERTLEMVEHMLGPYGSLSAYGINAREYAVEKLSITKFRDNWRSYVEQLEDKHV